MTNDRAQERMANCGYDISPGKVKLKKPLAAAKLPLVGSTDIAS